MTTEESIKVLNTFKGLNNQTQLPIVFDAIDAAISALESQRWIPVEEKLPEAGEMCFVFSVYDHCGHECGIKLGFYNGHYFDWVDITGDTKLEFHEVKGMIFPNQYPKAELICPGSKYITHWMQLPQPPKEEKCLD